MQWDNGNNTPTSWVVLGIKWVNTSKVLRIVPKQKLMFYSIKDRNVSDTILKDIWVSDLR